MQFKENSEISYTVELVKKKLLENFNDLGKVSLSTVRRTMKKRLRLSYKKVSKWEPKILTQSHFRKMLKSALLLQKLKEEQVEAVFIDKFSLNSRKYKLYGWGKVNSKVFIKFKPAFDSMSFIVGLSASRYYGIMGKKGSINSDFFKHYIVNLLKQYKASPDYFSKNLLIIADNATIHKSLKTNGLVEILNIGLLTITPYSPWINPVESYISAIKSKILKRQRTNR